MIASWMLYSLLVSALVATAAWLLEGFVRLRGKPVRWVWALGLAATVCLVAAAPARTAAPFAVADAVLARDATASAGPAAEPAGWLAAAERVRQGVRATLRGPLRAAAVVGAGRTGDALAAGWLALSAAALVAMALTLARTRRARHGWPHAFLGGERVRVAPRTGPAVLGVVRPDVVVPAWLLHAPAEQQRLVVLHEREHVRARDPLLLLAGCAVVALLPWNPAAWWMLLGLRAAVELDCDARVLRQGVKPSLYGTLLLDLAGSSPGVFLGAPAIGGRPSTLERRLRAMNARLPRFARTRAGLLATLGAAALMVACESPLPTSAEVEKMDVHAVEARVGQLQSGTPVAPAYYVDDQPVTAEAAHAIPADEISRVEVHKALAGNEIRVYTKVAQTRFEPAGGAGQAIVARGTGVSSTSSGTFEGLVLVDGVVRDPSVLRTIAPDQIATVDVLKGDAATTQYSDPRAANGVIRITTRAATSH